MPFHLLRPVFRRQIPRLTVRPFIMTDKMATYSPSDAKVLNVEPIVSIPVPFPFSKAILRTLHSQKPEEAKWIRLNKINYQDPSGGKRVWESAERQVGES
jgi:hypothetical protein